MFLDSSARAHKFLARPVHQCLQGEAGGSTSLKAGTIQFPADMAGRLGGGNLFSLLLLHYFNILLIVLAFYLLRKRIRYTESKDFPQGRMAWDAEQQLQPSICWVDFTHWVQRCHSKLSFLQPSEKFRTSQRFSIPQPHCCTPLLLSMSDKSYLLQQLWLMTVMIPQWGIRRSRVDNVGCRFHI